MNGWPFSTTGYRQSIKGNYCAFMSSCEINRQFENGCKFPEAIKPCWKRCLLDIYKMPDDTYFNEDALREFSIEGYEFIMACQSLIELDNCFCMQNFNFYMKGHGKKYKHKVGKHFLHICYHREIVQLHYETRLHCLKGFHQVSEDLDNPIWEMHDYTKEIK